MIKDMRLFSVEKLDYARRNLYRAVFICESPKDLKAVAAMVEDRHASGMSDIEFQGFEASLHYMAVPAEDDIRLVRTMSITVCTREERHTVKIAEYFSNLIK